MSAPIAVSVTPAMKADFDACMAILQPDDIEPFKTDVRVMMDAHGREYAATWLRGWRNELEREKA